MRLWSRKKLCLALALGIMKVAFADDLPIRPVQQLQSEWCWLAVGEMVLSYAKIPQYPKSPNYQCGMLLASARYGGSCPNVPAGNGEGIRSLLWAYPQLVGRGGLGSTETGPLSYAQIKHEIQNQRPVVIGVNPSQALAGIHNFGTSFPFGAGAAEHAALIIGFADGGYITVADPYPYPPFANPYLRVGATQIGNSLSYRLTTNQLFTGLNWVTSMHCLAPPDPAQFGGKPLSCLP